MALTILLADDSMTAQNMGKKILADAGYNVVTVSNGAAAVKKIAELNPDLVILDVYMPGYSGLEVCERVKSSPATARMPVLLTVGKMEPFRPEDGMKVKADGVIIKPFEATDLVTVVGRLSERVDAPTPPPAQPTPASVPPSVADESEPGSPAAVQHFSALQDVTGQVDAAPGLQTFAPEADPFDITAEPKIEFTSAPPVDVAGVVPAEFEPTALQEHSDVADVVDSALEHRFGSAASGFGAVDLGFEEPVGIGATAGQDADSETAAENAFANWHADEADITEQDLELDLEAEMKAAAAADSAPASPFEDAIPLRAPLGKTSFDELDEVMAETEKSQASEPASLPKFVTPAVDSILEIEPELLVSRETAAAEPSAGTPTDSGDVFVPDPDLMSEEPEQLPSPETPVSMHASDSLSGVFDLDAPATPAETPEVSPLQHDGIAKAEALEEEDISGDDTSSATSVDDDIWRASDYDDEPRTTGRSAIDLFQDACAAADAAKTQQPAGLVEPPPVSSDTEAKVEVESQAAPAPEVQKMEQELVTEPLSTEHSGINETSGNVVESATQMTHDEAQPAATKSPAYSTGEEVAGMAELIVERIKPMLVTLVGEILRELKK